MDRDLIPTADGRSFGQASAADDQSGGDLAALMTDEFLRAFLFAGISMRGIRGLVSRGTPKQFPKGTVLIRQGDFGENMYVILRGLVRVERRLLGLATPVRLAELGPGEVVGEMGLLDRAPRSATVTAVDDTLTAELSADDLGQVMLEFPDVANALLRTVSRRRQTTENLVLQAIQKHHRQGPPGRDQESRVAEPAA